MKKIILCIVCGIIIKSATAQFFFKEMDNSCFLLGTLNDYMGHQQSFTAKKTDSTYFQFIDIYAKNEERTANYLADFFKKDFPDIKVENNSLIRIYSSLLSKHINTFFDYKFTGSSSVFSDSIYSGRIKKELLNDSIKQLSFLTGFFFREQVNPQYASYAINIPNSVSKANLITLFLKNFKCEDVIYEINKDFIPAVHRISFTPSPLIATIIKNVYFISNSPQKTKNNFQMKSIAVQKY